MKKLLALSLAASVGFSGASIAAKSVLACFTAAHASNDSERFVGISNYQGISFDEIESAGKPAAYTLVTYSGDKNKWGIKCNDGWVNTGCSFSSIAGVAQAENGCFARAGNPPSESEIVYTTCCKLKVDSTQ